MMFEAKIIELLQAGSTEFWLYFFRVITLFGSWLGMALALIFVFFKKKSFSYAFFPSYIGGVGLNYVLKHIIKRPRPFNAFETILNLGNETGYSMPSGHACSAAIIAVFVSFCAIKYGKHKATKICVPILMALYVVVICLSRMFLGAHYLTDVLAGVGEGAIVAVAGIIIYYLVLRKLEKKNGRKTNKQ